MRLDLTPYNYWILYASIVILLITLCTTLSKVLKLGKVVSAYKPLLDNVQKNVNLASIKAQAVAGQLNQIMSIVKPAVAALGLLMAAKALYDKREENGIGELTKATSDVIAARVSKRNLISSVRKEIGI